MKKLEEIKFDEIKLIECQLVSKYGKLTHVCRVHTIDGKDYQIEPKATEFSLNKFIAVFK